MNSQFFGCQTLFIWPWVLIRLPNGNFKCIPGEYHVDQGVEKKYCLTNDSMFIVFYKFYPPYMKIGANDTKSEFKCRYGRRLWSL